MNGKFKLFIILIVTTLLFVNFNQVTYANDESDYDEFVNEDDSIISYGAGINFDEWRIITLDNNGNIHLQESVDYSSNPSLLKYVKKGDILYETTFGIDNYGEFPGHIAIVVDICYDETFNQEYILVVEAVECGVIYSVLTPYKYNAVEMKVLRIENATNSQINNAINFIIGQVGKPYGLIHNPSTDFNSNSWYCSELIYAGYYNVGIELPVGFGWVYPNDILNSDLVKVIMGENLTTTVINNINKDTHSIICNGDIFEEPHYYNYNYPCTGICKVCDDIKTNHIYQYTSIDTVKHRKYCQCGQSEILEHEFEQYGLKYICELCNFKTTHVHNFSYYPDGFGINHNVICSCGYNTIEPCIGFVQNCYYCNQEIYLGDGPILNSIHNNIIYYIEKKEKEQVL